MRITAFDALAGAVQILTFAPGKVKAIEPENMFNYFRKHTPAYRSRENVKKEYKFGEPSKNSIFKTTASY